MLAERLFAMMNDIAGSWIRHHLFVAIIGSIDNAFQMDEPPKPGGPVSTELPDDEWFTFATASALVANASLRGGFSRNRLEKQTTR